MQKTKENVVVRPITAQGSTGDAVPSIYYDGSCPLCTAEINHYASRIGRSKLQLVDVSMEGADLKSDLGVEDAMKRFHVRKPDGELLSGAKAFVEVWRLAPGWTWAARLASIPGVLSIMEVSYRGFLVVRPAISALATVIGVQAANPQPRRSRKTGEMDS